MAWKKYFAPRDYWFYIHVYKAMDPASNFKGAILNTPWPVVIVYITSSLEGF
jgi:hypothetical protein